MEIKDENKQIFIYAAPGLLRMNSLYFSLSFSRV